MTDFPTPGSIVEWFLRFVFGSPSLVVTTYLLLNFLWSWWSLGRGTVALSSLVLNRSYDRSARRSLKIMATARTMLAWVVFYLPAAFITQLWAGSSYSPGQGGGFEELLRWSGLFGALALGGCLLLIPTQPEKHGDPHWAPLGGLFGGFLLGATWAVIAFTAKGGPQTGDWWVAPAMSCIGVLGSAMRMRIRVAKSWTGAPSF